MWAQLPKEVKMEMLSLFASVRALGQETRNTGGKSTITVGKSVRLPDGRMFEVMANVGDGGAMKLREDGTARDITKEDSAIDAMLQAGFLTPEQAKGPDFQIPLPGGKKMTVKDARRQMYQALGAKDEITPRITVDLVRPGEKIVYMTDGLRDEFTDAAGTFDAAKASAYFDAGKSAKENAVRLNGEAAKGPKHDDKAVLIKERLESAVLEDDEDVEELSPEDLQEVA